MNIFKKLILIFLSSSVMLISACSEVDSDQEVDFTGWDRAYMVYSYPFNGQQNVSVKTSISLMFTHVINDSYMDSHFNVLDKDGVEVPGSVTLQNGNDSGLIFTPDQALLAGETYTVEYSGITSEIGEVAEPRDIQFSTVGVSQDASSLPGGDSNQPDPYRFQVIREFPTDELPFMDFSVIHLTFNQIVDISTVSLDNGFTFTEPGQSQSVAGKLMVKDTYIIFDPEEDLKPGVEYTLSLKETIKSRSGLALEVGEYSSKVYLPNDSQPRSVLVQRIYGEPDVNISPLSGIDRNTVPVNSTLMGNVISYADADYHTELAFIPNYPDAVPFVIRRGSVVKGSKMPVDIGGKVPAGFDTGEIYLTLITDATGYMISNINTDDENAPKQVRMVLDVSMSAQDPRANGGLSQDVLHIDLFGIGMTESGVLVVDTLGEINPVLLGVEKANGLVSFFLEAYADQNNAPVRVVDDVPPELQTWLPGDIIDRVDPADPLLLIFTEPLQPENLNEEVELIKVGATNEKVDVVVTHDGTTVIIKPLQPLSFDSEYSISVGSQVKDMADNPVVSAFNVSFSTLSFSMSNLAAPLVGSIHPGYSCKLVGMDLANNIAGRCEGGKESDDKFNIFKHPANRPIYINFNQLMDTKTFSLGTACGDDIDATIEQKGSIRVEEMDAETGLCIKPVDGSLHYDGTRVSFEPTLPWKDHKVYQIVLKSNTSSICDGTDFILCSATGLPLRTIPLTLTFDNAHQGSETLVMPFTGTVSENNKVYNPLSKLPVVDVNRNYQFDSNESTEDATGSAIIENSSKLSISGFGGLIREAAMGCPVNISPENCPDEKETIFVSGYLPTEVGMFEEVASGTRIPVDLHSQVLMTTSVTMYTKAILGISIIAPTGPQIMRMRGRYHPETGQSMPGIGYILWDENYDNGVGSPTGHAMFQSTMDVYLDAPGLVPTAPILGEMETNMHSLPLTIDLYGPIVFLPDGRMEIKLQNTNTVDIDVEVGSDSHVDLKILPNDLSINLVSKMVKS
jgi:hypothetical protein